MSEPRLPLENVVVVDLGQIYNAPYATLLMAFAGALVIKLEPLTGENLRGRTQTPGAGAPFVMLNSNKRGATLNLKDPRGRDLLLKMVRRADILVENYRPNVMDKLGVGPDVLREHNPELIYASGSGFGRTGPYRDFAAMDLTVQAMAGVMSITGFPDRPPVKAGPAIADFFGGIHLYAAILTALYEREHTGEGQVVEASMFESVYPSLMSSLGLLFGQRQAPTRTGNRHGGLAEAPYNVYPTKDGHVAIICVTDAHWQAMARTMGRPELAEHPDFATRRSRVVRIDEIDAMIVEFTEAHGRDELCDLLRGERVPCAPVRALAEVAADEQLHARGMLQEIDHPDTGSITVPHSPLRFSAHEPIPVVPSPSLGGDNEWVYREWLGLDEAEFETLTQAGVI